MSNTANLAIQAANLSKQYHIGGPQKTYDRLGDQVVDMLGAPARRLGKMLRGQARSAAELTETIWALEKVNFKIEQGETVGIIGRNGAGKSTLLKILSRITEPTEGYADIYGRVGSLLEVGTGFHPELTGRENVFLNGAILGMRKGEIERKFDEIVDFAEIDRFIDTPVKHYSSGMYVRLAFSVAAHLEPEILLVDEVLAVGDVAFQRKSLGKMDDVSQQGRTVLFVSHNLGLMQSICKRGILLEGGRITCDGPIGEAIDVYLASIEQRSTVDLVDREDRRGLGQVRLIGVEVAPLGSGTAAVLRTGETVRFTFHVDRHIPGMDVNFSLFDQIGQAVAQFKSKDSGPQDEEQSHDRTTYVCEIDPFLILPGRYRVDVGVTGDNRLQDYIHAATYIEVAEGSVAGRVENRVSKFNVVIPHRWVVPERR